MWTKWERAKTNNCFCVINEQFVISMSGFHRLHVEVIVLSSLFIFFASFCVRLTNICPLQIHSHRYPLIVRWSAHVSSVDMKYVLCIFLHFRLLFFYWISESKQSIRNTSCSSTDELGTVRCEFDFEYLLNAELSFESYSLTVEWPQISGWSAQLTSMPSWLMNYTTRLNRTKFECKKGEQD